MPAEDVDLRIRTRGARAAARDAERVGNSVGRIGSRARRSAGGMRLFTRATTNAGRGMRLTAGAALYGGAAIGGGLLVELKRSTDAWENSRKIAAQTGAVLRSTGNAAHVTAAQVAALSTSISRKTGIDDEAVQSGANMLLTFTRIRNETGRGNDIFTRATRTVTDMSAALGQDMPKSAIQLGKALNDPVKGVTALQRVGVTFTQGQRDQIKTLEDTGQHLTAQRIILRELNKEFGGSAAAQATPLAKLKITWGNLEEAIGHGMQPVTDRFFSSLDRQITRATPEIDALGQRLSRLMGRKDLTSDQKIKLGIEDVSRTLHPYSHELGVQLGRAFDAAAPMIGTAAANAAPRVAKAFIAAWWHMNPGAKLFTLALLGGKIGVFSALGELAFSRFRTGWSRGGGLPMPTPGLPGPTVPGPGKRAPGGGLLRKAAGALPFLATRVAVPVAAAATGWEIGKHLKQRNLAADERAQGRARLRGQGKVQVDIGGGTVWMSPADARGWQRDHARPRTRTPRARAATTTIHTHVELDGREVAQSVDRFHAGERARTRERRDRKR